MKLENLLVDKSRRLVMLCDLTLKHQDEGGSQEADSLAWSQADQPSYLRTLRSIRSVGFHMTGLPRDLLCTGMCTFSGVEGTTPPTCVRPRLARPRNLHRQHRARPPGQLHTCLWSR